MASGLYSQHLRDPKVRVARNLVMGIFLFFFAAVVLFPLVYMLEIGRASCRERVS